MVGEVGLEPTKPKTADLQSAPFAARDIPPCSYYIHLFDVCQMVLSTGIDPVLRAPQTLVLPLH